MRVKLDENVTSFAKQLLAASGHEVDTVADERMIGANDDDLLAACMADGRLLITFDLGFGDIRVYPPGTHAGVIVLRLRDQQPAATLSVVRRFTATHDLEAIGGALVVVTDERVRIRR